MRRRTVAVPSLIALMFGREDSRSMVTASMSLYLAAPLRLPMSAAFSRLSFLIALPLALSGCVSNQVRPLPTGTATGPASAVVIYGVGVEGHWKHQRFGIELAEYDVEKQSLAGHCFRFNRMSATVPATPGAIHYFAFEVPAGNYVYSPFNSAAPTQDASAFSAPAARTVYIGDFVYASDDRVVLRREIDSLQRSRATELPGLKGEISLATATPVTPPRPFLCAP